MAAMPEAYWQARLMVGKARVTAVPLIDWIVVPGGVFTLATEAPAESPVPEATEAEAEPAVVVSAVVIEAQIKTLKRP
jgi:hypothetical protein